MVDDVRPDGIKQKKTKRKTKPKEARKTVAEKRAEYFIYKNSRHAGFFKIGQDENQAENESADGENAMFGLAF